MYMWRELDLGEVRDELAHIADMGFETVRLFALTQDFLPERERVDASMVSRLVDVARVASEVGLSIVPTLMVINMSGKIWWPAWMLAPDGTPASLYSEPSVVRSQVMLVSACVNALAGDASIRAFDIANEIDDAQRPESRVAAHDWLSAICGIIRAGSPGVPVRIGAHLPSLTTNNNMRIDDLGAALDEDVMHAYPLYSEYARSFLDPELVPFACALTAGLAGAGSAVIPSERQPPTVIPSERQPPTVIPSERQPPTVIPSERQPPTVIPSERQPPTVIPSERQRVEGSAPPSRPTLMQEFGLCTAPKGEPGRTITDDFLGKRRTQYLASEEEAERYYDAVLNRLAKTGAAGAYAWCYADYDARLFDRPPLDTAVRERTFGLVRADGSEKPAARVFRAMRQRRGASVIPHSRSECRDLPSLTRSPAILDITADHYYDAPGEHFERLYGKWLAEHT